VVVCQRAVGGSTSLGAALSVARVKGRSVAPYLLHVRDVEMRALSSFI
jgi:hypothetical protein